MVAGIGIIVVILLLILPKNPIPGPIRRQLTSTLLLPDGGGAVADRLSAKYDTKEKLLTFNVAFASTRLVVSEQPTPDQFVDIPAVYTKLVDGLNNYESFDVNVGTVHLTEPKELSGKQAAVINAKGTLLFAKPDKNLTSDQWRKFFNGLSASS